MNKLRNPARPIIAICLLLMFCGVQASRGLGVTNASAVPHRSAKSVLRPESGAPRSPLSLVLRALIDGNRLADTIMRCFAIPEQPKAASANRPERTASAKAVAAPAISETPICYVSPYGRKMHRKAGCSNATMPMYEPVPEMEWCKRCSNGF